MNRRSFISVAGTAIVIAGVTYYFTSDTHNFTRQDMNGNTKDKIPILADEKEILLLASLAPSGHNTQPWMVKYIEPLHWIIGNDKKKWLPAVDPTQRETILSIGAFLQNLEYAAAHYGYNCSFQLLAKNNQDEDIMEVKLFKTTPNTNFDIQKIKLRRTVRSNYLEDNLKKTDQEYLVGADTDLIHFIPNTTKEHLWLNEQTIEANKLQSYRDDAQKELSEWIRFSSKEAQSHCDGLTTASMEIEGLAAWVLRNFYSPSNVMKKKFREQSIDKIIKQVSQSAGWFLITSKDNTTLTLLETGMLMQRFFLKVRERNIALHPMTQILEELSIKQILNNSIGISTPIQFILRTGYLKKYPDPVSLRRPISQFVHSI
jgi:hypothetical protein